MNQTIVFLIIGLVAVTILVINLFGLKEYADEKPNAKATYEETTIDKVILQNKALENNNFNKFKSEIYSDKNEIKVMQKRKYKPRQKVKVSI